MYTGAALCMWLLRGWKIGQLEMTATKEAYRHSQTHATLNEEVHGEPASSIAVREDTSSIIKRLFSWRKV